MKLKTKLIPIKLWIKIKKLIFKRSFHFKLYNDILLRFAQGQNNIRYYIKDFENNSIHDELVKYHEYYNTDYKEELLTGLYDYVETYLNYKLSIFSDVDFEYHTDENGLYFEIKLL